jgi:hypothetical protein
VSKIDEADLVRWRELPASKLLVLVANHVKRDTTFVPINGKFTERWHANVAGREFELITDGPKFFDTRAKKGGGGGVDLVMHLFGHEFRAASKFLRGLSV